MSLTKLLDGVNVLAIVCNQWGDTGKGKFSDYFASQWADVVARGTGGNNAGHTVVVNGKKRIFHLLPSGIIHDSRGVINILGNGMVIDLEVLVRELDELDNEKLTYNGLRISSDAHVIMPYHIERDKAKDQSQKTGVGSTGRGIGPCYADKIARRGIRVSDLFDVGSLGRGISKAAEFYPEIGLDIDHVIEQLESYAERIKPFVRDTVDDLHGFMRRGRKVLLEGAQGLLLSIEHGTYPYVTSSDCSLNGTASGVGLSAKAVDLSLGMVKFPFMTRVGAGPFPTELGGRNSELYCAEENTKLDELIRYGIHHNVLEGEVRYDSTDREIVEMMNSDDPFIQGIGIRLAAGEYGATTSRPRRIGWTDTVAAKYAIGINGPVMVLTKADAIAGANSFKVGVDYSDGLNRVVSFSRDAKFLRRVLPSYITYEGYGGISDIKNFDNLPSSLRNAISQLETQTGGHVAVVSVGPDREQTIVR
ncbi:MAG: adenylosuccinate synthetase [Nanoarchaeota archaeon]